MAELRPGSFPKKTDIYRAAERHVFDRCGALPSSWYALYSVAWIETDSINSPQGEADFVFIGPDIGLIVLEVKGGGISRTPDGAWWSIDRNGDRHELPKHPALQAQANLFAIVRYLDSQGLGSIADRMPLTSMVCFPHIDKNSLPSMPELPAEMIIDEGDLGALAAAMHAGVTGMNPTRTKHLTASECKACADALMPSFETAGRWSARLWDQKYAVDRLTSEQVQIVQAIQDNSTISLTGPAGCGKTVAAIHCGKRFLNEGRTVLTVTPSRALRDYYAHTFGSTSAIVTLDTDISDVMPGAWDCIIADEAQDITPIVLEQLLQYERRDVFKLFLHDSNQRLGHGLLTLGPRCMNARFTKVLRNTKEIATFSTHFYLNDNLPPEVSGPAGRAVEELAVESVDDLPHKIASFIQKMVGEEGFRYRDIVVLFGRSGGKILRKGGRVYAGISFRNAADVWSENCDDPKCVACCGILAFRGLESPVVVLCEVDELIDQELVEACYVGTSRAQFVLAVAGTCGTLNRIRSLDLTPKVAQRQRETNRERRRQSAAIGLSKQVSPGFCCFAKITGIKPYGVFCELSGTGCTGLLHWSKITNDKGLDLEGLYKVGQCIRVRVVKIEGVSGRVELELYDNEVGVLRRARR